MPEPIPHNPPPPHTKTAIAGVLMGIANLIPGVSGGTMIFAMGLYTEFIDSVADLSALRFSRRRIIFLGVLAAFATVSIVALASLILHGLFHYSTAMYALFIGLTLGGAPLLTKSLQPVRVDVVVATAAGLAGMIGIFLATAGGSIPHNAAMDLFSGLVASTTMVLPGISGSYMLLILDQYDRIVGVVADLKDTVRSPDPTAIKGTLKIIVPVGIGVVVGIVGLSNVLKFLLHRYHRPTLGFLLGLLLGSVLFLWPFGRMPSDDALARQDVATTQAFAARHGITLPDHLGPDEFAHHIRDKWESRTAKDYTPANITTAAVMLALGFLVTNRLGRHERLK